MDADNDVGAEFPHGLEHVLVAAVEEVEAAHGEDLGEGI